MRGRPEKGYKPYVEGGIKELIVIVETYPIGQFWAILDSF